MTILYKGEPVNKEPTLYGKCDRCGTIISEVEYKVPSDYVLGMWIRHEEKCPICSTFITYYKETSEQGKEIYSEYLRLVKLNQRVNNTKNTATVKLHTHWIQNP